MKLVTSKARKETKVIKPQPFSLILTSLYYASKPLHLLLSQSEYFLASPHFLHCHHAGSAIPLYAR